MAEYRTLISGAEIRRLPLGAEIRRAESADRARNLGQNRSLTPRADWDAVKLEVMRCAVEAKFTQDRDLGERLAGTGDEELIHESNTDTFWGRTRDGLGDNCLGVLLMQTRAGLRGTAEQSDPPKSPFTREFES
jgi:ribA/ribD-fused uncharacterized protein